ncbi:MAG: hypothetical protein MUD01_15035 [Chloroflexaceae bacterium]|nr:hypothetical protein [Chloroflexaceae bacterium]
MHAAFPIEHQLDRLRADLNQMGDAVVERLSAAIAALIQHDRMQAQMIINDDQQINRAWAAIEEATLDLITTRHPVGRDMRVLLSIRAIADELERIGDYAKNIAAIAAATDVRPALLPLARAVAYADMAVHRVAEAVALATDLDVEAAHQLSANVRGMRGVRTQLRNDFLTVTRQYPALLDAASDLLLVVSYLERVIDGASNIAEQLSATVAGELELMLG